MIEKLNQAAPRADDGRRQQLVKAAQAFEAVFARQMIGAMRQANLGEDLFGSQSADTFRELQDAKLADNMTAGDGLGIAKMLIEQFDKKGIGR